MDTPDSPALAVSSLRPLVQGLPASQIREVANAGMGRDDLIPLWFGEPDEPTPAFIRAVVAESLGAGETRYTPNAGVPELRDAIATYMEGLYGGPVGRERITVSVSGMNAVMIALQCLIDPGDGLITTGPQWPNLAAVARILDAEVTEVPLDPLPGGWHLDVQHLMDACTDRTRVLLLNSPNNPTGWMMTEDEQRAVLDFARRRGLWIVSDEVYARIVYDRPFAPSFVPLIEPEDRVMVLNSFSKSWCMTGWRLGWITAPPSLGPTLEKMTEFNIAGAPAFTQRAGVTALTRGEDFVHQSVARYGRARDRVVARAAALPRVFLPFPQAAFYAFLSVDGMTDSLAFAKRALAETGVGLAPGTAFGPRGQGWLRLCFAASEERIDAAFDRLEPLLR